MNKRSDNSAHDKILHGVLAIINLVNICYNNVNFFVFKILDNSEYGPIIFDRCFWAWKGKKWQIDWVRENKAQLQVQKTVKNLLKMIGCQIESMLHFR